MTRLTGTTRILFSRFSNISDPKVARAVDKSMVGLSLLTMSFVNNSLALLAMAPGTVFKADMVMLSQSSYVCQFSWILGNVALFYILQQNIPYKKLTILAEGKTSLPVRHSV
jgi:L-asparagine transporter-like permease